MRPVGTAATSVAEVLDLYDTWGAERYDEAVSQLDHALQCAALAEAAGATAALVAAALLHDVGHLLAMAAGTTTPPDGVDLRHEARGARFLAGLFPPAVTAPVALHVSAKRYLVATDAAYRANLSDGSARSLVSQGGPLAPPEVATFRRHPAADDALALRRWDDAAKVKDLAVAPLERYRALLVDLGPDRRA